MKKVAILKGGDLSMIAFLTKRIVGCEASLLDCAAYCAESFSTKKGARMSAKKIINFFNEIKPEDKGALVDFLNRYIGRQTKVALAEAIKGADSKFYKTLEAAGFKDQVDVV